MLPNDDQKVKKYITGPHRIEEKIVEKQKSLDLTGGYGSSPNFAKKRGNRSKQLRLISGKTLKIGWKIATIATFFLNVHTYANRVFHP